MVMPVRQPIKNLTEQRVIEILTRSIRTGSKYLPCQCSLCLAQLVSKVLNRLKPRYWQKHTFGTPPITDEERNRTIALLTEEAKRVVPFHDVPGAPCYSPVSPVVNLVSEQVGLLVFLSAKARKFVCSCSICTADIMNVTLNRLPHRYLPEFMTAEPGRRELQLLPEQQLRQTMTEGISLVGRHPHHT